MDEHNSNLMVDIANGAAYLQPVMNGRKQTLNTTHYPYARYRSGIGENIICYCKELKQSRKEWKQFL